MDTESKMATLDFKKIEICIHLITENIQITKKHQATKKFIYTRNCNFLNSFTHKLEYRLCTPLGVFRYIHFPLYYNHNLLVRIRYI